MTSSFDAVVAGHLCLDIHPDLSRVERGPFEKIFQPGRLLISGPVSFSTGGAVSNTGVPLSRLGITTRLVGKIGDDLFGQTVCQVIASHAENLTQDMIVDSSAGTS